MAFEMKDFFRSYVKRGDQLGIFNSIKVDAENSSLMYVAYMNESGSYIIERISISGNSITFDFYGKGMHPSNFADDWTARAGLTYVEYNDLFPES
jgi:hypothetical protein